MRTVTTKPPNLSDRMNEQASEWQIHLNEKHIGSTETSAKEKKGNFIEMVNYLNTNELEVNSNVNTMLIVQSEWLWFPRFLRLD